MFTPKLNPLACRRCQMKKVRCSRQEPMCSRCCAAGLPCVYNKPRRRGAKLRTPGSDEWASGEIADLPESLRRFTQLVAEAGTNSSRTASDPKPVIPLGITFLNQDGESRCRWDGDRSIHLNPIIHSWPCDDILRPLTKAIYEFRKLTLKDAEKATPADPVTIPVEQARALIELSLEQLKGEMFVGLVDPDLMKSLPDVVDTMHNNYDQSILLVYYLLLYKGCLLQSDTSWMPTYLPDQLYLKCVRMLPAWRREAATTPACFMGALAMSFIAGENQDYELSWSLHRQACRFALLLGLNNFDKSQNQIVHGLGSECMRQGFWQLIQSDINFRLFHNVRPTISGSEWAVDMPWLRTSSDHESEGFHPVSRVSFIVNSRLTFIGMEYFRAVESSASDPLFDLKGCIERICDQIGDTIEEWQLRKKLEHSSTPLERMLLADVLLSGYNMAIIVNSKLPCFFPTASCNHWSRAVEAARSALQVMLAVTVPAPSYLTIRRLFLLRPFVSVLTLYENLNRVCDGSRRCEDINLLDKFRRVLATGAVLQRNLEPVVETLNSLIRQVCARDYSQSLENMQGMALGRSSGYVKVNT